MTFLILKLMLFFFRYQLWPLDKKLRIIKTAKDYVKRHESEMQEKFAQSLTLRSILQQTKHLFIRFLHVSINYDILYVVG